MRQNQPRSLQLSLQRSLHKLNLQFRSQLHRQQLNLQLQVSAPRLQLVPVPPGLEEYIKKHPKESFRRYQEVVREWKEQHSKPAPPEPPKKDPVPAPTTAPDPTPVLTSPQQPKLTDDEQDMLDQLHKDR